MSLIAAPFHADERAAQVLAGFGSSQGAIYDRLTEQHRAFFQALRYVLVGALDDDGWPLATILSGSPGFVSAPDPATLAVAAARSVLDPAAPGFQAGRDAAMLGIDLFTRRRNRVNGTLIAADAAGFSIRVQQAFGNCPKYITRRSAEAVARVEGPLLRASRLDEAARALIGGADTFFVATRSRSEIGESGRVDISHRGGLPGFVLLEDHDSLLIPDYRGNRYLNTLGNLLGDARASLLFVDFDRGDLLQLQGEVTIDWSKSPAERRWRFKVSTMYRRPAALPLAWHS